MASTHTDSLIGLVKGQLNRDAFKEQHWEGSFEEYLAVIRENPWVIRNSFQRLHSMILTWGTEEVTRHKEKLTAYKFFADPIGGGQDAIYGLERPLGRLVSVLKSAAHHLGSEKRVILLHGPVGSSKSTIVRLLKRGLEEYTRTPAGALYTFGWMVDDEDTDWFECPMHEEPLVLIPEEVRPKVIEEMTDGNDGTYDLRVTGDLCPVCRFYYNHYLKKFDGDWEQLIKKIRVRRLILSEQDRVGIGTFQPKDEKNQDSTELTGDINYRKIAEYGSESDPRAFNFDGEFNIANRGLVEFIELLKLDVAFLYDLLGASQEHSIKPKKFAQTHIDEVIIGHTNEAEYKKLQNNDLMEAFRDRTIKIDIPYNVRLDDEIKIYEKDYAGGRVRGKHIAPHTFELVSMWALLTRLEPPKKANLTMLQKLKLYNGKTLTGYTEDNIRELMAESPREGMEGISPRYIQDKVSNAIVSDDDSRCVNPFMVLNELERGLSHHSLISDEEVKKRYRELLSVVKQEYEDIAKNEVQRAIASDEESIKRLCSNYIDNVKAYTQNERVKNKYTGQEEEPDEQLLRSIEEKINVDESRKDDFRREIMNYIGALALEGRQFDYRQNERLQAALEAKLFEDQKDTIKLTSLISSVVDRETQEKIDVVKTRLIKAFGYCDICSTDVLNYVASIFARGDTKTP